mgnify:CR=1 FL=1
MDKKKLYYFATKLGRISPSLILCVQEVVTPIYIMSYYIKWVTTSWTYGKIQLDFLQSQYTQFTAIRTKGKT